jgi:tripartite ATP-independent transporter DctP family solute receptor
MEEVMSKLTRRSFVKAAAAASTVIGCFNILSARAVEPEFKWKFGSVHPVDSPIVNRVTEIGPKILEESKGRLDIQVFPNSQLGGETDMLSQVRSGALEMFPAGANILQGMNKQVGVYGVAFAFPDYDHVWQAMDGDLGAHLRGLIGKLNFHVLDKMWDIGFRQVTTSNKPINAPDDFKGFKIRVPPSAIWTSLFQGLGASPVSINFPETYSALQTKIADGEENPLWLIQAVKFYEVQKYVSLTNHMWDGNFTIVNQRAWRSLPADLQELLSRNFNEAVVKQRQDLVKLNETVTEDLKMRGMVFNTVDIQAFRAQLSKAGYYKQWKGTFGDDVWALLEKYSGGPLA